MPKIVDHTERKTHIAEATWRVIMKQGMEGASVRNIANEAGLSLGALRHYFSTQQELLAFAMNLVKDRAAARIHTVAMQDLPPKDKVIKMLLELLPTDDHKMAEMEVWFAFTFHRKQSGERFDAQHDGILVITSYMLDYLDEHHLLNKELDKQLESERLYGLLDGLALHALLEPGRLGRERIVRVLTYHIDSICIQ